ncbi:MAG: endo-1,4-beta-xylanase [Bacteroidota bacterium]
MKNSTLLLGFLALLVCCSAHLTAQQTLREVADAKKVYVGNLISIEHLANPATFRGGAADANLTGEYNTAVLENSMKMSFVLPVSEPVNIHDLTVDQLRATLRDNFIQTFLTRPEWAGLRKRGHAMIWFNQAPNWLNASARTWTGQQVFAFSRKYILALGQICGDQIDEWDVINEAISDQTPRGWRERTWYENANDGSQTDWGVATYENYIKMLFVWAREAQPNARLHYNDYGIEHFNASANSKNGFMRAKFKALKDCGAPIDGIGFQSHFLLSDMVNASGTLNQGFIDAVERSMEDLATADLEVAVTELDIRICNGDRSEAFQEQAFRAYAEMALAQPNCQELLVWGLRDEDHWITLSNNPPFNGCQDAVLFEGDYTAKPAYDGMLTGLQTLPDRDDYNFAALNPGDGANADCGGDPGISPVIVAVEAPDLVPRGDSVELTITYRAAEGQQVVVFFQLDEQPFTVFSDLRVDVPAGQGTLNRKILIPANVEVVADAYQFQTILVPAGGGWPDRVSNLAVVNVSVDFGTSLNNSRGNQLALSAYPNPVRSQVQIVLPASTNNGRTQYELFTLSGQLVSDGVFPPGANHATLDLAAYPVGGYLLRVRRQDAIGQLRLWKQ